MYLINLVAGEEWATKVEGHGEALYDDWSSAKGVLTMANLHFKGSLQSAKYFEGCSVFGCSNG